MRNGRVLESMIAESCLVDLTVAASRASMLGCGKIPASRIMSKLPERGISAQYVLPLTNLVLVDTCTHGRCL